MEILQLLEQPHEYVMGLVLLLFGSNGFRRGWVREITALGGIFVSWLFGTVIGPPMSQLINRLHMVASFWTQGGFDGAHASALVDSLGANPLIGPGAGEIFQSALFLGLSVASLLASKKIAPPPNTRRARALGGVVGVANGYLLQYVLLKFLTAEPWLRSSIPLNLYSAEELLSDNLLTATLVGVGLLIILSLASNLSIFAGSSRPNARR